MRLRISLICCLAFLLNSCKEGPKVMVCISDPQAGGFDCFDQVSQKSSFLKYADSDKYVAMPPTDAQSLFDYCAQGKGK